MPPARSRELPPGRSPRATNISSFLSPPVPGRSSAFWNGADTARQDGDWPEPLRRAWRWDQPEAVQEAPDNVSSVGARAEQYSS
jgi:hypothetical protein